MSKDLKFCYKFFLLFGLSFKSYDMTKSFRENLLSVFSITSICIHLLIVAYISVVTKTQSSSSQTKLLLYILFFSICFFVVLTIFESIMSRNHEKLFWNYVFRVETIFKYELKVQLIYKSFKDVTKIKLYLTVVAFIFCQGLSLATSIYSRNFRLTRSLIATFMPLFVLRVFVMKVVYFTDVLHFFLKNIELKLRSENATKKEVVSLKKVFTLCWKMCQAMDDVFGWSLLLATLITILGTLFSGYNLCIDIQNRSLNTGPLYSLISIVYGLAFVSTACHNCVKCSTSIMTIILKTRKTKENFKLFESFLLQLTHQKIHMSPKMFFKLDHEHITNVSIS